MPRATFLTYLLAVLLAPALAAPLAPVVPTDSLSTEPAQLGIWEDPSWKKGSQACAWEDPSSTLPKGTADTRLAAARAERS